MVLYNTNRIFLQYVFIFLFLLILNNCNKKSNPTARIAKPSDILTGETSDQNRFDVYEKELDNLANQFLQEIENTNEFHDVLITEKEIIEREGMLMRKICFLAKIQQYTIHIGHIILPHSDTSSFLVTLMASWMTYDKYSNTVDEIIDQYINTDPSTKNPDEILKRIKAPDGWEEMTTRFTQKTFLVKKTPGSFRDNIQIIYCGY